MQIPYGFIISCVILSGVFLNDHLSKRGMQTRSYFIVLYLLPNIVGAFGLRYLEEHNRAGRLICYYLTCGFNAVSTIHRTLFGACSLTNHACSHLSWFWVWPPQIPLVIRKRSLWTVFFSSGTAQWVFRQLYLVLFSMLTKSQGEPCRTILLSLLSGAVLSIGNLEHDCLSFASDCCHTCSAWDTAPWEQAPRPTARCNGGRIGWERSWCYGFWRHDGQRELKLSLHLLTYITDTRWIHHQSWSWQWMCSTTSLYKLMKVEFTLVEEQ